MDKQGTRSLTAQLADDLGWLEQHCRSHADLAPQASQLRLAAALVLLQNAVIWDCPDMTTWAATGYVPRLLEVAGLADVIVYVASDERYNDEVPTQFLHLLLRAGKAVVVCLVKMREVDAPAFVAHFKKEVLGRLAGDAIA